MEWVGLGFDCWVGPLCKVTFSGYLNKGGRGHYYSGYREVSLAKWCEFRYFVSVSKRGLAFYQGCFLYKPQAHNLGSEKSLCCCVSIKIQYDWGSHYKAKPSCKIGLNRLHCNSTGDVHFVTVWWTLLLHVEMTKPVFCAEKTCLKVVLSLVSVKANNE